jgi:hypothetical protein
MRRMAIGFVATMLLAISLSAQTLDHRITPGVVALTDTKTICSTVWGRDARHVSEAMKKEVCLAYGISSECPGPKYELDHLVPRELGGADDVQNLWPQLIAEAHQKDRVENFLHVQVCAGKISLVEAQRQITEDWRAVTLPSSVR